MDNRRDALKQLFTVPAAAVLASTVGTQPVNAVQIYNTSKGVKYAITKDLKKGAKETYPQPGDIVAVDFTGYKTNGQIFDATHSEGKSNALLFKLGSGSVIPGFEDIVSQMVVGQKVQAIIPPELAYGDKGVCLPDKPEECLVKPGETLVYDILLVKASIPPP